MNNQLKPSAFVGYTNFDLTINLDNNENINDRITVDNIFRNLGGMAANTACFSSFLGNNSKGYINDKNFVCFHGNGSLL